MRGVRARVRVKAGVRVGVRVRVGVSVRVVYHMREEEKSVVALAPLERLNKPPG